jgi:hypothetical protein
MDEQHVGDKTRQENISSNYWCTSKRLMIEEEGKVDDATITNVTLIDPQQQNTFKLVLLYIDSMNMLLSTTC